MDVNDTVEAFGQTLGEELLKPTKIYVNDFLKVKDEVVIKGMVHVTGGGFYENIPRILPKGLSASIDLKTWEPPAIFKYMQEKGNIEQREMFTTFNMGIGLIFVIEASDYDKFKSKLPEAIKIGKVVKGDYGVKLWA